MATAAAAATTSATASTSSPTATAVTNNRAGEKDVREVGLAKKNGNGALTFLTPEVASYFIGEVVLYGFV